MFFVLVWFFVSFSSHLFLRNYPLFIQLFSLFIFCSILSLSSPFLSSIILTTFLSFFLSIFILPFSTAGSVYDYTFSWETKKWVLWMKIIDKFEIDTKSSFSEIIVPTTDSVRNTYLLDLLLSNDKHVLCVGGTGTGKTVNISQYLMGAAKVQGASRTLFSLFFIPLFFRYFFFLYFFAPSSLLFMLRLTFSSPLPFHPISIFCRPYSTTKRDSPNYNFFCEYKCEHDPRSS